MKTKLRISMLLPYGNGLRHIPGNIISQMFKILGDGVPDRLTINVLCHDGSGDPVLHSFAGSRRHGVGQGGQPYPYLSKGMSHTKCDVEALTLLLNEGKTDTDDCIEVLIITGHSDTCNICFNKQEGSETMTSVSVKEVATTITQVLGKVNLLFLQNCNMGTVRTLNAVGSAADYVLASQHYMGAPNTYYEVLWDLWKSLPDQFDVQFLASMIGLYERQALSLSLYNQSAFQKINFERLGLILTSETTKRANEAGLLYYQKPEKGLHLMDISDLAHVLPVDNLYQTLSDLGLKPRFNYASIIAYLGEDLVRDLFKVEITRVLEEGCGLISERRSYPGNHRQFIGLKDQKLRLIDKHSGLGIHMPSMK
jgi:hypothetical protein